MNATAYTDALLSLHGLSLPLSLGLCFCMCGSAKLVCLGWTNCLAHVCLPVCLISASALLLSLSLSLTLYAPLSALHSPHVAGSVSLRALSCSLNVLCCLCEQLFKLKANDVVVVVFSNSFFNFYFFFTFSFVFCFVCHIIKTNALFDHDAFSAFAFVLTSGCSCCFAVPPQAAH